MKEILATKMMVENKNKPNTRGVKHDGDILGYLNLTNSMICGFAMFCRQIGISLLHQWILSLGPKKMDTPIWPTEYSSWDHEKNPCLARRIAGTTPKRISWIGSITGNV